MTKFAIYKISTNEVAGGYIDSFTGELSPLFSTVEAPDEFELNKPQLWKYDPDAETIVLKTGDEFNSSYKEIKRRLIKKYFNQDDTIESAGDIEGAVDTVVQMLHHFANQTVPSQQEIDNWNAFVAANAAYFRIPLADPVPNDVWLAMGKAKQDARTKEQELKNDPEWKS